MKSHKIIEPWPSTPAAQSHFCYALCVLDHVQCEHDSIKLSEYTQLTKARKISNKYGRYILGKEAIAASQELAKFPWDYEDDTTSFSINTPFNPEFISFDFCFRARYVREYKSSDCVLEVRFRRDDHSNSNGKCKIVREQVKRTMEALRLIDSVPIRAFGPVEFRAHPSMLSGGPSWLMPGDEILWGNIGDHNRLLRIDRKRARLLHQVFKNLGKKLTGLEIALRRLNLSFSRGNTEDQFIDTIIGLEALYNINAELRFRLALRAAYHQEHNYANRLCKYERVLFLYAARNQLIHGSAHKLKDIIKDSSPYNDEVELIDDARDILRTGCLKAIMYHPTDWKAYLEKDFDKAILGKRI